MTLVLISPNDMFLTKPLFIYCGCCFTIKCPSKISCKASLNSTSISISCFVNALDKSLITSFKISAEVNQIHLQIKLHL